MDERKSMDSGILPFNSRQVSLVIFRETNRTNKLLLEMSSKIQRVVVQIFVADLLKIRFNMKLDELK